MSIIQLLACFKADVEEIDHHSYETGEWHRIKDWCDRFEKKGIQLKWGPGTVSYTHLTLPTTLQV